MRLFTITSKNLLFILAPVSLFLLASCGSYQYSGYEDGIYGEANRGYERQNQNATQESNSGYYQNLFAEEAALYGEVLSESTIFTDVDSYSSTGNYQPGENQTNYIGGQAPWGNDPDSYAINIYNNGLYGGFYNPYWGGGLYAFDPFWGPGFFGPSWHYPGFYGPGFYGPYWRSGWNVGFGFGHHYGYGMGFGGFYGNPFWYNPYTHYTHRYNNFRQNVAYNTGRRDAASSYMNGRNNSAVRNASVLDSRNRTSSYSRSIRNLRSSNDDYGLTRRSVDRTYDPRRNSDYNTNRSMQTRRTSNDTYSRSQMPSRNSGTVRSSTPTRSSGTVRSSSGSTTRSSSGSGTSSRGRGN